VSENYTAPAAKSHNFDDLSPSAQAKSPSELTQSFALLDNLSAAARAHLLDSVKTRGVDWDALSVAQQQRVLAAALANRTDT
jgi:hypothetical protein